jgi:hypothetical protein
MAAFWSNNQMIYFGKEWGHFGQKSGTESTKPTKEF